MKFFNIVILSWFSLTRRKKRNSDKDNNFFLPCFTISFFNWKLELKKHVDNLFHFKKKHLAF